MANKGVALMANYGLEEEDGQFKGPLSYKQYLWHILQCHFWGDKIILYAISCMWNLWITVLNSRTLEEYRIWHSFSLADADVGIVYNCVNHYSAAGECWSPCWSHCSIYWSHCSIYWSCCWLLCMVNLLVTLLCLSVCADEDLEKYVLETLKLCCTMFKLKCPADTEDEALVGISSEDEAEDMDLDPAIIHRAVRQAPVLIVETSGVLSTGVMSMAAATGPIPGPEEVIVKKAALVTVQKQMAALVRGEDLPAREVQDMPYVVPVVGGEDTKCPICHLVFMTPYQLREHMDVHRGEQFPCGNCSRLLASCHMLKAHQKSCIQGSKFICEECGWEYATKQGLRQHTRVTHGPEQPAPDEVFICPFCAKQFGVKKSMREHITTCSQNPAKKGPFFCCVEGCKSCNHPFSRMKNLNAHMASCHGWKTWCQ